MKASQAMEFRQKFQLKSYPEREVRDLQMNLITEEFKELLAANASMILANPETRSECLKELTDLLYVVYQYAAVMGWDLDEAYNRVHESNLSKLNSDGKPVYRKDGKLLKGSNYQPPFLADLV